MDGLLAAGEAIALAAVLPQGTPVYVGLLTTMPTANDGTGAVEVVDANYERAACSSWSTATEVVGGVSMSVRRNAFQVEIGNAFAGPVLGVVGWGIYDALTGGNLLASGPLQDAVFGSDLPADFAAGDIPVFAVGELAVGVG